MCAPNRDNHLVTTKLIARRYEHILRANPTWKIDSIKATVLKDFFADVSTSKCKAAKKIVSQKLLEGMKEEYTKVFDYQLELLRSNPGSTVLVGLDPKYMDQNIFQRFYVCFNAMKKGLKHAEGLLGLMVVSSKELVKVNFFVLLVGMLTTKCTQLLGQ